MRHQTSRAGIRQSLRQELQSPAFLKRFNRFKNKHPELSGFNTPQDIVDFFHTETDQQAKPVASLAPDHLLNLIVTYYRVKPKTKGWLLVLLLSILWEQMNQTFCRFRPALKRINPFDPFAPVYAAYIDALLDTSLKTAEKFSLHLKDRAEWLIRKELRECNRFTGEIKTEPLAPELLPWQEQVEDMLWEWSVKGILNRKQSELVIYHIVYEYTFAEIAEQMGASADALRQRFHRAIAKLKPYLQIKFNIVSQKRV
ncbi:MAG: sigma-70 region 4 domain-containing protein [Planctomycetes bacterium]|nr:sigma-70 region 4 domain-containing protein [Planctomycetota bacterium]